MYPQGKSKRVAGSGQIGTRDVESQGLFRALMRGPVSRRVGACRGLI